MDITDLIVYAAAVIFLIMLFFKFLKETKGN
jgi:hypothetical protein